jgi:hypothetical protein
MNNYFYFGRIPEDYSGHILYDQNLRPVRSEEPRDLPFSSCILDGGLLPPYRPQTEGRAMLIHFLGMPESPSIWTVLTFWDRSVDHRGNSCSAFVFRGNLTFTDACTKAREVFPRVWQRFTFLIYLDEGKD